MKKIQKRAASNSTVNSAKNSTKPETTKRTSSSSLLHRRDLVNDDFDSSLLLPTDSYPRRLKHGSKTGSLGKRRRTIRSSSSIMLMIKFLASLLIICVLMLSVIYYVDTTSSDNSGGTSNDREKLQLSNSFLPKGEVGNNLNHATKNDYNDHNNHNDKNVRNDKSSLTMYGEHKVSHSLSSLPKWIQEYVQWNQEARLSDAVADNTSSSSTTATTATTATKYLVLMCLPKDVCGGLSDRFRALPFHLFVAKHTSRVLCIYWTEPYPLEEFLEPPPGGLDWRCPPEIAHIIDEGKPSKRQRNANIALHRWFRCHGTPEAQCTREGIENIRRNEKKYMTVSFMSNSIDNINKVNSIVHQHSYVGRYPELSQWSHSELMGDIFRVMFQPVRPLAQRINETMTALGMVENQYVSVHVRARYPVPDIVNLSKHKTTDKDKPKFGDMDTVDKGELEFEGATKDYLVEIINNAIHCGHILSPNLPIYFASDHHSVTDYVVSNEFPSDSDGGGKTIRPLGLQSESMPLHMDIKNVNRTNVEDFYNIFEDLLIMGGSKCVAYGVGSYGSFGAGLTGNRCRTVHRKSAGTPVSCPNIRGDRIGIPINASELFFDEGKGGEGKLSFDNYPK